MNEIFFFFLFAWFVWVMAAKRVFHLQENAELVSSPHFITVYISLILACCTHRHTHTHSALGGVDKDSE